MTDTKNSLTIKQISEIYANLTEEQLPEFIDRFSDEERTGVVSIVKKAEKKYERYKAEIKRIHNMKRYEDNLRNAGYKYIAGTDEVGRGPLCGPVVSCVVVMKAESEILYINDSKKLSKQMRNELYKKIVRDAVSIGIGVCSNKEIDRINILNATKASMQNALMKLSVKPEILLLDAITISTDVVQKSFIKGDEKIYSIAAASIVAKVIRDRMMSEYSEKYPEYNLVGNNGYGTLEHIEAIKQYGLTPIHRRSFVNNIDYRNKLNLGRHFEEKAKDYLISIGYEYICSNYNSREGEIDLIFKDEDTLVFVEVKARKMNGAYDVRESITPRKISRLHNTAEEYMMKNAYDGKCRFDAVLISFITYEDFELKHYKAYDD